mmetsp:Transcript_2286/g.5977  ORF Transcript_2286/g.5977 Transcript_2286/m.5977 type:complete len:290 (+) Transcript_2286:2713-3582(+)
MDGDGNIVQLSALLLSLLLFVLETGRDPIILVRHGVLLPPQPRHRGDVVDGASARILHHDRRVHERQGIDQSLHVTCHHGKGPHRGVRPRQGGGNRLVGGIGVVRGRRPVGRHGDRQGIQRAQLVLHRVLEGVHDLDRLIAEVRLHGVLLVVPKDGEDPVRDEDARKEQEEEHEEPESSHLPRFLPAQGGGFVRHALILRRLLVMVEQFVVIVVAVVVQAVQVQHAADGHLLRRARVVMGAVGARGPAIVLIVRARGGPLASNDVACFHVHRGMICCIVLCCDCSVAVL